MLQALGRSINLLLVEDNPADACLFVEGLREANAPCRLMVADSGQMALDILFRVGVHQLANRPDLILLDLNLPGLNGHEVLRAIKQDHLLRLIPVVILTSSQAATDITKAYGQGANSYFQKPITVDQNFALIRTLRDYWFNLALLPL